MRKTELISLVALLVLAVGANGWGQQCCRSTAFPPAGQYTFPTSATLQVQLGPNPPMTLQPLGPTMVRAGDPVPNPSGDVIQTEIVALSLMSADPIVGNYELRLATVSDPGAPRSMGQTIGQPDPSPPDYPANSFFDVFVEVSLEHAPWLGGQPDVIYTGNPGNQYQPVRVTDPKLGCIPPPPNDSFCTSPGFSVLLTSRRTNQVVGQLISVWHVVLPPNHYKTWKITDFSPPQIRQVIAKDQFMVDNLVLDSAVYLSNPAQKCVPGRCFNIADTTDHFTWYQARGRETLLDVDFTNQFQQSTVRIDSVKYFLLPTHKFPHNPPRLLDHYKAYKIRNPQQITVPVQLLDQFDLSGPENINLLIPRYFLTPAQKNTEPVYDTLTHFVAYEINPKRLSTLSRDIEDQFGIHPIRIDSSVFVLVPTCKLRAQPPPPEEACCLPNGTCQLVPVGQCAAIGGTVVPACLGDGNFNGKDDACEVPPPRDSSQNHYKTWRVVEQGPVVPRTVSVLDQIMRDDNVRLDSIQYLSNPVQKCIEMQPGFGICFDIVDTTDHLTWYRAFGRDTLLQIVFQNQFTDPFNQNVRDSVLIDSVRYLLLPTRKFPHQPPVKLDHYKAYRIRNPRPVPLPGFGTTLLDQFDLVDPRGTEFIVPNEVVPRYFLTPARKDVGGVIGQRFDTLTHYVAYEFNPKRPTALTRDIEDQFGIHILQVDSSVLILVPTKKLKVEPPPPQGGCCLPDGKCVALDLQGCLAVGGTPVPACLGDLNGNGKDDACERPEPCDSLREELIINTTRPHQLHPGDTVTVCIKITNLFNNRVCCLDSVIFEQAGFGIVVPGWNVINKLTFVPCRPIPPGGTLTLCVLDTIPGTGHGCIRVRKYSDCCNDTLQQNLDAEDDSDCGPKCDTFRVDIPSNPQGLPYNLVSICNVPVGWTCTVTPANLPPVGGLVTIIICTDTIRYTPGDTIPKDSGCVTVVALAGGVIAGEATFCKYISYMHGDVAGDPVCPDGVIDIVDIVGLINNVVYGADYCAPMPAGDVAGDAQNCPDGIVDIVDIVGLINNVVFSNPLCCK